MDKATYAARKADLLTPFENPALGARAATSALSELSRLTDNALAHLWTVAGLPASWALVAVGGYGRGELFPASDIDVLILRPDGALLDESVSPKVEAFVSSCWDMRLEIGSSVRTVSECMEEAARDVTVQTALLESRHLHGDAKLTRTMQRRFLDALNPQAFFVAKTLEMRQRHAKYENTPYSLEPNCKESPGGLRDLHVVLWVAKAAGLGSDWDELRASGLLSRHEVQQIKRNLALMTLIRARLHRTAKRREDRLVFDLQTQLAEQFGYTSTAPSADKAPRSTLRPSEQLMRRYYWAAKAITQLNQILLLGVEERLYPSNHALRPINERFYEKAGMLEVASDDLYERQPHAILETFLLYQTTVGVKGLSARTLRALYNARGVMDASFRRDPVNRQLFLKILQQPAGITHAMRLMNQTSVLGRTLWVFRRIVGQMQHDLFHIYTVDQHILMVLRNVRRFFIAEHAHEYPLCSQLAAGWEHPWLLYAAALFHDIAKGRGGDHSALGAQEVERFCKQFGVGAEDAHLIGFLVREHLTMSHVAQKQDMSDPEVIQAFAQRLPNERYLTALYLLTVADIRGTSPKVWNNWKGKLLEDLYRITLRVLGGHAPDPHALVEDRKREALVLLALQAMPHQGEARLWATLGVDYFMRHEAPDIAWHTRHVAKHIATHQPAKPGVQLSRPDTPSVPLPTLVRARGAPHGDGFQVLVYTPDATDLFARICGYFEQTGFSIQDAKLHATTNGYVLDTFQVVTQMEDVQVRELVSMVESELARVIDAAGELPAPRKGRISGPAARWVKSFPIAPRVNLRPDERAQRWLLSVSATDRPGLLYGIARVLTEHRLNIELAKIMTLGERVEDVFVISGSALLDAPRRIAIETELLAVLM